MGLMAAWAFARVGLWPFGLILVCLVGAMAGLTVMFVVKATTGRARGDLRRIRAAAWWSVGLAAPATMIDETSPFTLWVALPCLVAAVAAVVLAHD